MEERYFSVEKAASLLGCTTRTVHNLLARGWLKRPNGRPRDCEGARVSEKSLFQLVVYDRTRRLPASTLSDLRRGRKIFAKLLGKSAEANCLSTDEKRCDKHSANSSPEIPKPKRCLNEKLALERQFSFGWLARQLEPNDPSIQDDLVQEMSLAILEYNKPASPEFLFEIARNRAKNYLKYEARRGMMSLRDARRESDAFATKMNSLKSLIYRLTNRGVPVEWIEEVLGEKLDVA